MPLRTIETEADLAEGAAHLTRVEPRFGRALAETGPLPLRRREAGFASMLGILVAQQLSVAAADGIWRRLEDADLVTEDAILAADQEAMRACGLSRPKCKYAKEIAGAQLDWHGLGALDHDAAMEQLTAIKGVGRWTAEIYLMFAVGRRDVFAPGDLALQESARLLFDLPERPSIAALDEMSAPWSPWRAVAARLLWSYYRVAKGREGVAT